MGRPMSTPLVPSSPSYSDAADVFPRAIPAPYSLLVRAKLSCEVLSDSSTILHLQMLLFLRWLEFYVILLSGNLFYLDYQILFSLFVYYFSLCPLFFLF